MNTLNLPLFLIPIGILLSASAQLGLKMISVYGLYTRNWFIGIMLSVGLYGAAFVVYSFILRKYKVSIVAPLMSTCVIAVVVLGGVLLGETLTPKQIAGVCLAIIATILLI